MMESVVVNKSRSIGITEDSVPTREYTPEEWERLKRKAFREAVGEPGQKKFKKKPFLSKKKKRK